MSKAPAFQFYPSDWLEKRVLRMSDAAQGVYMRILCYMWNDSDDQCSIESSAKVLQKLLGLDPRTFKKVMSEIQWPDDPIFIETGTQYISERLRKEKEKHNIRSEKARHSIEARWNKDIVRTNNERNTNVSSKYYSSSSSSKRNIPPVVPPLSGGDTHSDTHRVIDHLNAVTGKRFSRTVEIEARLADGGTVADCIAIIDAKKSDDLFWKNGAATRYMNPTTLFRASHWDNYLNEAMAHPGNGDGKPSGPIDPYALECAEADAYRETLVAADPSMHERFAAKVIEPMRGMIPENEWTEQIERLVVLSRTKGLVRLFHPRRRPRAGNVRKIETILGVPVEVTCTVPKEES